MGWFGCGCGNFWNRCRSAAAVGAAAAAVAAAGVKIKSVPFFE